MNEFYSSYQFISVIGLIADIIGVIILFRTGLPFKLPERNLYIAESLTDEQISKDAKQKRFAYLGLSLLIIGFALQIVASICSYYS